MGVITIGIHYQFWYPFKSPTNSTHKKQNLVHWRFSNKYLISTGIHRRILKWKVNQCVILYYPLLSHRAHTSNRLNKNFELKSIGARARPRLGRNGRAKQSPHNWPCIRYDQRVHFYLYSAVTSKGDNKYNTNGFLIVCNRIETKKHRFLSMWTFKMVCLVSVCVCVCVCKIGERNHFIGQFEIVFTNRIIVVIINNHHL